MAFRFNPPPNWPTPPEGFVPEPGWTPDPAWGPAPEGWNFWVEEEDDAVQPAEETPADDTAPETVPAETATDTPESSEPVAEEPAAQAAPETAPAAEAPTSAGPADSTQKPTSFSTINEEISKPTLILGISFITVLVLGIIAIFGIALLSPPKDSQATSSSTRSASPTPSATPQRTSTPSPTSYSNKSRSTAESSNSATPSATASTAGSGSISMEDANKIYQEATDLPATPDFPEGSYNSYSSNDTTAKSGSEEALDYYTVNPERIGNTQDIAWAELKVTPKTDTQGSFTEEWDTTPEKTGSSKYIAQDIESLIWSEAGKEYQYSFWLPARKAQASEKITIAVPKGSTWTLTVHPADHAPLVSGAVRASSAQAFRYDVSKSKTNTLRLTSMGSTDNKQHSILAEIASRDYAQKNNYFRIMTTYSNNLANVAFQDDYHLTTDSGLGGEAYITVSPRYAQWVISESPVVAKD